MGDLNPRTQRVLASAFILALTAMSTGMSSATPISGEDFTVTWHKYGA